jgi:hypothetical protein
VEAETLPPAPVEASTGRRRRRASPGEVAEGIARQLVDDGLAGYPLLPDDVDDAGAAWCSAYDLEPAPPSLVREALAALPGVTRARTRLRADDGAHVALARRLRRMGRPDDRATLFTVAAVPKLLALNPSPASATIRAKGAGRGRLALGFIARHPAESATAVAAGTEGEAESTPRPRAMRGAA